MNKIDKKIIIVTTFVSLLPIIMGVILYPKLPDMIPTHFDYHGKINGYTQKYVFVFFFPIFMALFNSLMILITNLDPKRKSNKDKIVHIFYWIIPIMSVVLSTISYLKAINVNVNINIIAAMIPGFTFLIIGNYMPKIKQNYTFGIRLPWTLDDPNNWEKTHRFAGPIWFSGGLIMIFIQLFSRGSVYITSLLIILTVIVLAPTIYSYNLYRKTK